MNAFRGFKNKPNQTQFQTRRLLDSRKIGKTWYFTPVNDLEQKLAELS